jgi:Sel1 repeat
MSNAAKNCVLCKLSMSLASLLISTGVFAQSTLPGMVTMGSGDVAAIKQKAEAGDVTAQVELGDALASRLQATEALTWYRKAANQKNIEGEYHVGQMLLFGAPGDPSKLSVQPDRIEGLRWTFMAATNFHAYACWNMAKALRQGLGTGTNLVEAYAWLKLFSETSAGSIVGRVEMNELALKMDTSALQRAQDLAAQFKAGKWQVPITLVIPEGDTRLKLNGITFAASNALAIINGKTLSEGESAVITLKTGKAKIKCLKIEKDSVMIAVEGESEPRRLQLK